MDGDKEKGGQQVFLQEQEQKEGKKERKKRGNIVGFVKEMKGERERVFIESVRSVLTLKENKKKDKEHCKVA